MYGKNPQENWADRGRAIERRGSARSAWLGEVEVRLGQHGLVCEGLDLSVGGIWVASPWSPGIGQSLIVSFRLAGELIQAFGEVAWVGDSQKIWGIRFTGIHPTWQQRITEYVEGERHRPEPWAEQTPVPVPVRTGQTVKVSVHDVGGPEPGPQHERVRHPVSAREILVAVYGDAHS